MLEVDFKNTTAALRPPPAGLFAWPMALLSHPTAQKGALAIADQLVLGATNFVTIVLIARAAGNEELGHYTLGLSLLLFGQDLQNSLVLTPYIVFWPRLRRPQEQAAFAGNALLHSLALALLAMAALGLLGLVAARLTCWGLILAVPAIFLRQHARMVSFAQLNIPAALWLDVVVAALQCGFLLLLARAKALNSASQAFAAVAVACGVGVGFWLIAERVAIGRPRQALVAFHKSWRFSRWLALTTPVGVLRSQLPVWLLGAFHGAGALGHYAAGMNLVALANPFLTGTGNLIGARAAHLKTQEGAGALRRFTLLATVCVGSAMALFFLVILFCGGPLLRLIYGNGYGGLGGVTTLLAAGAFVGSLSAPAFRGLLALEQSRLTLVTECLMLLLQASAGAWLVMRWGAGGAALGVLLAGAAGTAYQLTAFLSSSRAMARREEGEAR